ncbi:response regulator transcription factor [Actinospongicola halichondriae]|uniref:response regulator transcription factor n=1 Tax=Actinospongicola halichondriae TaxID=3236844 RepID=UPI003D4ACA3B
MEEMPPAILVVDDEPDVRSVIRSVLEADGYQVVEASDGPAALTLLRSVGGPRGPQLVVLDVMMPGIDGIEVCRQIPHGRTKVLMLTARDDAETRDAAMDAGADRFMTKPFSAVDLLDATRELLAPAS